MSSTRADDPVLAPALMAGLSHSWPPTRATPRASTSDAGAQTSSQSPASHHASPRSQGRRYVSESAARPPSMRRVDVAAREKLEEVANEGVNNDDMTLQEAIALGLVQTEVVESRPQAQAVPRPKSALLSKLKLGSAARRSVVDADPVPAKGPTSPRISASFSHTSSSSSDQYSIHTTHSPPVGVSFFLTGDVDSGVTHPVLPPMPEGPHPRQRTSSGFSLARRISWKRGTTKDVSSASAAEIAAQQQQSQPGAAQPDSPVLGGEKRRRVESLGPWAERNAIGPIVEEDEEEGDGQSFKLGPSVVQDKGEPRVGLAAKMGTPKYEAPEVWVHPPDDVEDSSPVLLSPREFDDRHSEDESCPDPVLPLFRFPYSVTSTVTSITTLSDSTTAPSSAASPTYPPLPHRADSQDIVPPPQQQRRGSDESFVSARESLEHFRYPKSTVPTAAPAILSPKPRTLVGKVSLPELHRVFARQADDTAPRSAPVSPATVRSVSPQPKETEAERRRRRLSSDPVYAHFSRPPPPFSRDRRPPGSPPDTRPRQVRPGVVLPKRPDQVVRRSTPPSPLTLDFVPYEEPLQVAFHSPPGETGFDLPPLSPDVVKHAVMPPAAPPMPSGSPVSQDSCKQNDPAQAVASTSAVPAQYDDIDTPTNSVAFPTGPNADTNSLAESRQSSVSRSSKFLRRMSIVGRKSKADIESQGKSKTLRTQRSMPSMARSVPNSAEDATGSEARIPRKPKKRFSFSNLSDVFRRNKQVVQRAEPIPPVPALPMVYKQQQQGTQSTQAVSNGEDGQQGNVDHGTSSPRTQQVANGTVVPERTSSVPAEVTHADVTSGLTTARSSLSISTSQEHVEIRRATIVAGLPSGEASDERQYQSFEYLPAGTSPTPGTAASWESFFSSTARSSNVTDRDSTDMPQTPDILTPKEASSDAEQVSTALTAHGDLGTAKAI